MIRYATICSGIEAPSIAWEGLGYEAVFFSEIAKYPSRLLAHHYPHVENLGDMTTIDGGSWRGKVDVLWGSTPCQAFSMAGSRAALDDPRGRLTLKFCDLADEIGAEIVCWENVKGALSAKENAFGQLLGRLCGVASQVYPDGRKWGRSGYVVGPSRVVAWRLLDGAYGGLAARRERVFVVASAHECGVDARNVLFERIEGGDRAAPRWAPLQRQAFAAGDRGGAAIYFNCDHSPKWRIEQACTLRADTGSGKAAYVYHKGEVYNLDADVRELLLGFPRGYTRIPGATETQRCAALGNSVAIPDARWIGAQIGKAMGAVQHPSVIS